MRTIAVAIIAALVGSAHAETGRNPEQIVFSKPYPSSQPASYAVFKRDEFGPNGWPFVQDEMLVIGFRNASACAIAVSDGKTIWSVTGILNDRKLRWSDGSIQDVVSSDVSTDKFWKKDVPPPGWSIKKDGPWNARIPLGAVRAAAEKRICGLDRK